MCQTCRSSIEDVVNEEMRDPENARVLLDFLAKMNDKVFPETYMETLVGKRWGQSRFNVYDAWVMSRLHYRYFTGGLLTRFVLFTSEDVPPFPDKERENNNRALSYLQAPFKASFSDGTAPGDGMLDGASPYRCDG